MHTTIGGNVVDCRNKRHAGDVLSKYNPRVIRAGHQAKPGRPA